MDTITAVLISVHVLISVALIALVLLNSGKGGGLSDMLGGPGSSCLLYTSDAADE